jgi:hypothetical protein
MGRCMWHFDWGIAIYSQVGWIRWTNILKCRAPNTPLDGIDVSNGMNNRVGSKFFAQDCEPRAVLIHANIGPTHTPLTVECGSPM